MYIPWTVGLVGEVAIPVVGTAEKQTCQYLYKYNHTTIWYTWYNISTSRVRKEHTHTMQLHIPGVKVIYWSILPKGIGFRWLIVHVVASTSLLYNLFYLCNRATSSKTNIWCTVSVVFPRSEPYTACHKPCLLSSMAEQKWKTVLERAWNFCDAFSRPFCDLI